MDGLEEESFDEAAEERAARAAAAATPTSSRAGGAAGSSAEREKRKRHLTPKASLFVSSLHSKRNYQESLSFATDMPLEQKRPRRPSKVAADPDFVVGKAATSGKRSKSTSETAPSSASSTPDSAAKPKRGRPPKSKRPLSESSSTHGEPEPMATPDEPPRKKKRGRPKSKSLDDGAPQAHEALGSPDDEDDAPLAAVLKKREDSVPKEAKVSAPPPKKEEELPLAAFKPAEEEPVKDPSPAPAKEQPKAAKEAPKPKETTPKAKESTPKVKESTPKPTFTLPGTEDSPLCDDWEEEFGWLAWDADTRTAFCHVCHPHRWKSDAEDPWIAGIVPDQLEYRIVVEHDASKEHRHCAKLAAEKKAAEEAARAEELRRRVEEWKYGREVWLRERRGPQGDQILFCYVCAEAHRLAGKKGGGGGWVDGVPLNRVGSASGHEVTNMHKRHLTRHLASLAETVAPKAAAEVTAGPSGTPVAERTVPPLIIPKLSPDFATAAKLAQDAMVKCEEEGCGKAFRTQGALASHVRHYHAPPPPPPPPKRKRTLTGTSSTTTTSAMEEREEEDGGRPTSPWLDSEDVVRCKCRDGEENGFMVQCERCETWQHGDCFGIATEGDVPEDYVCYVCTHPPGKRKEARNLETGRSAWASKGTLPTLGIARTLPPPPRPAAFLSEARRAANVRKCLRMAEFGAELSDRLRCLRLRMHVVSNPAHPWHAAWTAEAGSAAAEKLRIRQAQAKIQAQLDSLERAVEDAEGEWSSAGCRGLLQSSPEDALAAGGLAGVSHALTASLRQAEKMAKLLLPPHHGKPTAGPPTSAKS